MERTGLEPPLIQLQSLEQTLQGGVFPLSAEQLVWLARENEAPAPVLSLLSGLPRGTYGSPGAVQRALEAQRDGEAETSR